MKTPRLLIPSTAILLLSLISGISFAHNWMAPETEAKNTNPIPVSPESTKQGKEIYMTNCSFCHGEDSTGMKKEDTGLSKDAPNLVKSLNMHSEGDFHWKIQTGKDDMPSFKEELSDTQIWHVINYLKSLNK